MLRDDCQTKAWALVGCVILAAACDGSRPGLLGDYATAISALPEPTPDAATPADPPVDAGAAPTPAAPLAMPSVPAAGSAPPAPTAQTPPTTTPALPSTTPTAPSITSPATQPTLRAPDYVAVATETVGVLPVGIEQYICTLTDLTIPEDTWVTAVEVVPQHPDYTFRGTVSVGPGGGCDGLGIRLHNVFDYFPSSHRLELREGDALLFPAGALIQVQFHHSGLTAKAPSTDTKRSEVRLWTLPKCERPK